MARQTNWAETNTFSPSKLGENVKYYSQFLFSISLFGKMFHRVDSLMIEEELGH